MTSPSITFTRARVVLPDSVLENGTLVVRDGKIAAVGPADAVAIPPGVPVVDARGQYLAPGFVDLHIHGGAGADYMDGSEQAVRTANRAHARHGVTTVFPTTTTGSRGHIDKMLRACRAVRDSWRVADGSRIAGVHFYGPYFAAAKVGCHPPSGRRDPAAEEYLAHFDLDIIRIATCAAELPGAVGFYDEARRRGCLLTCGHSNASWTEMKIAFEHGVRHVDHFWSAMSNVTSVRGRFGIPMQGSMEQFVLAYREMSTEVIADGCHLAPELLDFAFQMKGVERLCLVSDTSRALDMPPGDYVFGPEDIGTKFTSNGRLGYQGNESTPASSVIALDHAVRQMKRDTRASLPEVVRMASLTPAERAGIAGEVGSLAAGKRADVILLDDALNVRATYLGGVKFE